MEIGDSLIIQNQSFTIGTKFRFLKGISDICLFEVVDIGDGKKGKLLRCKTTCIDFHSGEEEIRKKTLQVFSLNKIPSDYIVKVVDESLE